MNIGLELFLMGCILIYLAVIFLMIKKKTLNLRYALIWIFSAIIMFILVIFPQIPALISNYLGIVDEVNLVFLLEGMFVLIILLALTGIVSRLNDKNRKLSQTIALLEKRIRDLEN